ncbi:MAG: MFS transporter [Pseudobdellovibrionaceae bacterium]
MKKPKAQTNGEFDRGEILVKFLGLTKPQFSWTLYDWANSSFSTTVMAGFFPIFFKQYWSEGMDPSLSTARLGLVISVSSLFIAFASPTLGTLSDRMGNKKIFLMFFCLLGISASISMTFIPQGGWIYAALAYGIGLMGLNASSSFYDSLLPSVASGKQMDYVSSVGYAMGYLGGGILFLMNVVMYQKPQWFGLESGLSGVQFSFFTVGLWWFVFTLPLIFSVEEKKSQGAANRFQLSLIRDSFVELKGTLASISSQKNIFYFLLAFWLYIDGVYTIMTMAVDFGLSINLEPGDLIQALLLTQFIGFPSAWLFGKYASKHSCKAPILICISLYALTTVVAIQMSQAIHFYMLAAMIGLVQGGVQSLSRSLFARMIPKEKSGEYFGFFNLVGKFAAILGPQLVALQAYFTGDSRSSLTGLIILFALGAFFLKKVQEPASTP